MSAMAASLTDIDRRLLDRLQRDVPLVERPFGAIAESLGLSETDVIDRVRALSGPSPAPIRQMSAIFDSKRLGYQSCLVAAKVEDSKLASAAAIISAHPGVSHNYRREHAYNLWFTLAVPPDSKLGLEGTIDVLHQLSGAEQMRLMPAIKLYKIGVKFDLGGEESPAPATSGVATESDQPFEITSTDKQMIRVLQQHLPIEPRPFDRWAGEAGVGVSELLHAAERYRQAGVMRRFSAVLRHREVGVSANAMGVWIVSSEQHDRFGEIAAQNPAVSHCYLRPRYPDWPYSIFTMVHGKTRDDCQNSLAAIAQATGIKEWGSLYSTVEYKKVRVKYFVGDIEAWEAEHTRDVELSSARPY